MVAITDQIAFFYDPRVIFQEDIQFVVRGYSWRPFLGFYLPYIDILSEVGLSSAPLFGEHTLIFTREHFCLECLNITLQSSQYCEECSKLTKIQRLECVTKGAGTPFNQYCDPNHPQCKSLWAAQYCRDEHVVYLAGFGELFKVGVTRARRWNSSDGYKYRLIEQGADCATVLRGNLNLASAQELEQLIADSLGLVDRVGFEFKAREFAQPKGPQIETLRKLSREAATRFDLRIVCTLDLSKFYNVRPELKVDDSIWEINDLLGRVVYVRGNILYFRSEGFLLAHDLHSLRGRGIICEED